MACALPSSLISRHWKSSRGAEHLAVYAQKEAVGHARDVVAHDAVHGVFPRLLAIGRRQPVRMIEEELEEIGDHTHRALPLLRQFRRGVNLGVEEPLEPAAGLGRLWREGGEPA